MPLEAVLDQPPSLSDQHGGLCDLLPGSLALDVGLVGQLIHIVADSRQLPKQGGVFVRGTGPELYAHDELADKRVNTQTCYLSLPSQMIQFLPGKPNADMMVTCTHKSSIHFLC